MRRSFALPVATASIAIAAAACSPVTKGPSSPIARASLFPDFAIEQAAVRATALAFVDAYAHAAADDGAALRNLVEGDVMSTWVHWLGVQNDELGVELVGTPNIGSVGPEVALIPANGDPGVRSTNVEGSIRFEASQGASTDLEPFERTLDGEMVLHVQNDGRWRVVDFTRDGVPISAALQIPEKPAEQTMASASITVDSLFAYPTWQFDLRISAGNEGPIQLAPHGAELVGATGDVLARTRAVTSSVRTVRSGTSEGLVEFAPLDDVADVSFRLTFDAAQGPLVFEFPLEPILSPIIGPASTRASPSVSPTTSTDTATGSA
jgi:hypothetical protein